MQRTRPNLLKYFALPLPLLLCACALLLSRQPAPQLRADRLELFPRSAPLSAPAQIYWNDYDVPFIEAQSDRDLAFLIGVTQAHLRLGQMELLKRVAQGRLSESAGPFTIEIDHALRILNFRGAARTSAQALDAPTREWISAFVDGVNYYATNAREPPPEFAPLNIRFEQWTVEDVLTVGRLASTDVNWLQWLQLLQLRGEPAYADYSRRLYAYGAASTYSFTRADATAGPQPRLMPARSALMERLRAPAHFSGGQARSRSLIDAQSLLAQLLRSTSRSGSNAFALAPGRTAEGAAILAGDPHLGLTLPNLWVIMGVKSPSYHGLGFMLPGVPALTIGRTPHFAWGGTNMRGRSSDLYDVTTIPETELSAREETIAVRAWPDQTIRIRSSPAGPILSDASVVAAPPGRRIALRWAGHNPSNEIGAFLNALRAQDFSEFRQAFADYAVSSQNFLYADAGGSIAHILAYRQPLRDATPADDFLLDWNDPAQRWRGTRTPLELPYSLNPRAGFLASANNAPTEVTPPINPFYGDNDRVDRMAAALGTGERLSLADVKALQLDVQSPRALQLRDALAPLLNVEEPLIEALRNWDGRYTKDSRGALALQLVAAALGKLYYEERYGAAVAEALLGSELALRFILDDVQDPRLAEKLPAALALARPVFNEYRVWGAFHQLRLQHPLGNLPLLGAAYRYYEGPVDGSSTTLYKSAHALQLTPHTATYGAQSRHIHVLNDPDANYFALLGGQDGWPGAEGFMDQWPLWRAGEYMRIPLRLESVQREFHRVVEIAPADASR